jgi:hypothetical protein
MPGDVLAKLRRATSMAKIAVVAKSTGKRRKMSSPTLSGGSALTLALLTL